jgi:hypothetical protein
MRLSTQTRTGAGILAALLLALSEPVAAHSWIEMLMRIAGNGTMVGEPGFQRGAVPRSDSRFNDDRFVNIYPPNGRVPSVILPTDKIEKHPVGFYPVSGMGMLKASPGDFIALRHLENGHVSLPGGQPNKPLNRGTIYIYGTSQARDDDTLMGIHLQWTVDGAGGDKRGKLLATRNYDDGQCYEANDGSISKQRQQDFPKKPQNPMGGNLWCQADFQLPEDLPETGTYTLYWVWDWPTLDPKKTNMDDTKKGNFPSSLFAPAQASVDSKTKIDDRVVVAQIYTSSSEITLAPRCKGNNAQGCLPDIRGIGNSKPQAASDPTLSQLSGNFVSGQDLNFAGISSQLKGNNFDVKVPGGNAGGGNGAKRPDSSAPPFRNGTSSTVVPKPTSAPARNGGVVTVTVTAEPKTVTAIRTVTANKPANTKPAASSSTKPAAGAPKVTPTNVPKVSPFLKARATGLRRRTMGDWAFGVN